MEEWKKVQTVDCVVAITKYFFDKETDNYPLLRTSLWKRLSKTGSGNNIVRTFQNKETGTIMTVHSTETKITKVFETPGPISSIKEFLRENLINAPEEFWNVHYDIFGEDTVVNWPQVPEDPEDTHSPLEPLDMENFSWLSVTDDELVIACGGDWQEPFILTIKIVDGKLTVVKAISGYEEGLGEDELMKAIQ